MIREDLVEGAVTFLQDPSVASAPVEQKIAFLRSKNLTQEEIDASLARIGQPSSVQAAQPQNYPQQYRQPQPQQYGGYQQQQYWGQPPLEPQRRDWRDWFIMATLMSGASYAVYWTAKRYLFPLIAPPTPPQLEQDKASIDASFDKAFALLDQLATDTQELKDAEKARKERLDIALAEVESVISKIKDANEARETESKRIAREMTEIREQIPMSIQHEKNATDERLKELAVEMKSLKTLVSNRLGQPTRPGAPDFSSHAQSQMMNGTAAPAVQPSLQEPANISTPPQESAVPVQASAHPSTSARYGRFGSSGKPEIPAWQRAAKAKVEKAEQAMPSSVDTMESGTAMDAEDTA